MTTAAVGHGRLDPKPTASLAPIAVYTYVRAFDTTGFGAVSCESCVHAVSAVAAASEAPNAVNRRTIMRTSLLGRACEAGASEAPALQSQRFCPGSAPTLPADRTD